MQATVSQGDVASMPSVRVGAIRTGGPSFSDGLREALRSRCSFAAHLLEDGCHIHTVQDNDGPHACVELGWPRHMGPGTFPGSGDQVADSSWTTGFYQETCSA